MIIDYCFPGSGEDSINPAAEVSIMPSKIKEKKLMNGPRTISIFGATGSVGTSTLDLIRLEPEKYNIVVLTANRDVDKLAKLAIEFSAKIAVIADEQYLPALEKALKGYNIDTAGGSQALVTAAEMDCDWTMAAIVGCAGLNPTLAAIKRGKTVALANKESLVSAGSLMMEAVQNSKTKLLPVDSEHNALFQCLAGASIDQVRKLTLTASGGPFRTFTYDEMMHVTPEQAVAHPNWSMGAKISVDSATMMNKGLELIEAYHLFPIGLDKIDVLVHPQSVIHSMVEYIDRSTIAQLGSPDMCIPIANALAWPDRMSTHSAPLDLAKLSRLDFETPDYTRFPALSIARNAISEGGAKPAILNAVNEIAVDAFLQNRIGFLDIVDICERVLSGYAPPSPKGLDDLFAIDSEARVHAGVAIG